MRRRPPRSTLSSSSAASDVYKRQVEGRGWGRPFGAALVPGYGRGRRPFSKFRRARASVRLKAQLLVAGGGEDRVRGAGSRPHNREGRERGVDSVSYTHLRAHETPEHL